MLEVNGQRKLGLADCSARGEPLAPCMSWCPGTAFAALETPLTPQNCWNNKIQVNLMDGWNWTLGFNGSTDSISPSRDSPECPEVFPTWIHQKWVLMDRIKARFHLIKNGRNNYKNKDKLSAQIWQEVVIFAGIKSSTNRDGLVIFKAGNFVAGLECTEIILTIKIN